jgi:hypothetical protein
MATQTKTTEKSIDDLIAFKFNETQVKSWKKEHGEIHQIDVIGENDEIIRGIFKKPTLAIIMAADAMSEEKDFLKRAEFSFTNCFIAGDPRLHQEEDLKVSAGIQVYGLFKIRPTSIVKL